jgi:SagB-type dehydrogenase family enzyme
MNDDGSAAREYHQATDHSLQSVRSNQHQLVWNNQPRPFKLYVDVDSVALADVAPDSAMHALDAISSTGSTENTSGVLTNSSLASLLHYSAGITKRIEFGAHTMEFRAAACTGALYHIDVYVVTGALDGLEAGVYQFGPQDGRLHVIRLGDYRSALIDASGAEAHARQAQALLVLTTTFWRNSWKYQARAYRHAFWDSGTMLANTLAVARAHEIPATVVMGFNDDTVNRLLGLYTSHEVAVALVPLGRSPAKAPPSPSVERVQMVTLPYSDYVVVEAHIQGTHEASSLARDWEAAEWRDAAAALQPVESAAQPEPSGPDEHSEPIESVIRRRGSARRFQRTPISMDDLDAMLYASTRGIPSDVLGRSGPAMAELYVIVNAVDSMASGAYTYKPQSHTLDTLRLGDFRSDAGYLDLGQELAADAAVNVYILADLERVFGKLGSRGYRAAQLEASIIGGKLYLASYARNLAATGLTFFDDDVIRFFGPHAERKSVMFLTAIGHRAARMRIG